MLVFRLSPCVVGGCGTVCLAVEASGGRLGWESLPLTVFAFFHFGVQHIFASCVRSSKNKLSHGSMMTKDLN